MLSAGHTDKNASLSETNRQDTQSPCHEPAIIDHTLSRNAYSTFGVMDNAAAADDHNDAYIHNDDNHGQLLRHKSIEKADSLHKDGLEDNHSSFSTFSVPANRFL